MIIGALALLAGGPLDAHASRPAERDLRETLSPSGLKLAQAGDVEIYYDGRGRQVIVDTYTGEILAI